MGMQNADFCGYSDPLLVFTAIHTAATMLQLDQNKASSSELPSSGRASKAFFFTEFKSALWKVAYELERGIANSPVYSTPVGGDTKFQARLEVQELAQRLIEFYKVFDRWHCGLNQLKTFKKLSFNLHVASTEKLK
jgi:hypothetical protein